MCSGSSDSWINPRLEFFRVGWAKELKVMVSKQLKLIISGNRLALAMNWDKKNVYLPFVERGNLGLL